MKKFFYVIPFFLLFVSFSCGKNIDLHNCRVQKFTVSGYYSPKKGQDFYYRGNFRSEIRLNGKGYRGASNKKVFNGMIAAPENYSFGTKIYFPGYGVGEVSDRGEAIVNAGVRDNKYDRIDIWMGKGEDGLKRALSFGKRELKGYVCNEKDMKIGFDMNKFPVFKHFFGTTLWGMNISQGRQDKRVLALQKYLSQIGYMDSKNTTSYFGPITKRAVCNYQVDKGIVSKNSRLCGYFGPKTRSSLKRVLKMKNILPDNLYTIYEDKSQNKEKKQREKKNPITFERGFVVGEKSDKIKFLQKQLKELGYYKGELNGTYTKDTAESVYEFQVEHNILNPDSEKKVLGYFGPKTRTKFKKIVANGNNG